MDDTEEEDENKDKDKEATLENASADKTSRTPPTPKLSKNPLLGPSTPSFFDDSDTTLIDDSLPWATPVTKTRGCPLRSSSLIEKLPLLLSSWIPPVSTTPLDLTNLPLPTGSGTMSVFPVFLPPILSTDPNSDTTSLLNLNFTNPPSPLRLFPKFVYIDPDAEVWKENTWDEMRKRMRGFTPAQRQKVVVMQGGLESRNDVLFAVRGGEEKAGNGLKRAERVSKLGKGVRGGGKVLEKDKGNDQDDGKGKDDGKGLGGPSVALRNTSIPVLEEDKEDWDDVYDGKTKYAAKSVVIQPDEVTEPEEKKVEPVPSSPSGSISNVTNKPDENQKIGQKEFEVPGRMGSKRRRIDRDDGTGDISRGRKRSLITKEMETIINKEQVDKSYEKEASTEEESSFAFI